MSDACAAIGISNRIGLCKTRHIEVTQLWVQEKVANGEMVILKVPTESNLADALTKGVDAQTIARHVIGINAKRLCDRHALSPSLDDNEEEEIIEERVAGAGNGVIVGGGEEGVVGVGRERVVGAGIEEEETTVSHQYDESTI